MSSGMSSDFEGQDSIKNVFTVLRIYLLQSRCGGKGCMTNYVSSSLLVLTAGRKSRARRNSLQEYRAAITRSWSTFLSQLKATECANSPGMSGCIQLQAIPTYVVIHSSALLVASLAVYGVLVMTTEGYHAAILASAPSFTSFSISCPPNTSYVRITMHRYHLVALCSFSYMLAYVLSTNLYPNYGAQNSSLVLPTFANSTGFNMQPRPILPYHVLVTGSETSVQFTQYFALTEPNQFYPCIIQALVEIYEAAIYDHGDRPLRGNIYVLQKYDVIIDIKKYARAPRNSLKYATVVRTLQAVMLFTHDYGPWGLQMTIFEEQVAVGLAVIRHHTEDGHDG